MVTINKIYTKTGDTGETALGDGSRVKKFSPRVVACGETDELNAVIGLLHLHCKTDHPSAAQTLNRIRNELFDCGADLCVPLKESEKPAEALRVTAAQVTFLETEIDRINQNIPPLRSFILPGGSSASTYAHLARTVARRAERAICILADQEAINPELTRYFNRLSDYLFVLCRHFNQDGADDVLWQPGMTG